MAEYVCAARGGEGGRPRFVDDEFGSVDAPRAALPARKIYYGSPRQTAVNISHPPSRARRSRRRRPVGFFGFIAADCV